MNFSKSSERCVYVLSLIPKTILHSWETIERDDLRVTRNPAENPRRINDCVAFIRERRKNVNRRYLCDTRGTCCVKLAAPAPTLTSF